MLSPSRALFICLLPSLALSLPTSWRDPNNTRPLDKRISIAQAAVNTMLPHLDGSTAEFQDIGYWQSANAFSAMANLDHITKKKTNQAKTVDSLNTAFKLHANYDKYHRRKDVLKCITQYNDDALWWATGAYYAYRAYGDSNLLSHAVATWNHVSQYVITTADANSGKLPKKSFKIAGKCYNKTMAGGVFWRPTADDTGVNSITTGLYLTLSAFLAEATKNSTYSKAAALSANWIKTQNLNADNIVLDSVDGQSCKRSSASWLFTYNTGKYLEGLSVLTSITKDSSWKDLMTKIANAAMNSTAWEGKDGIITEGASPDKDNDGVGFKAIYIRGLHEVYSRSSDKDLRTLIHDYIDVQYNAILELAANGTSYSSRWHGPPQGFTTWGQLASLDPLVSAIDTNQ